MSRAHAPAPDDRQRAARDEHPRHECVESREARQEDEGSNLAGDDRGEREAALCQARSSNAFVMHPPHPISAEMMTLTAVARAKNKKDGPPDRSPILG